MWPIILSDQLRIFGLVSLYLTNYLILRKLILQRLLTFEPFRGSLSKIQTLFLLGLQGRFLRVTHPFATPLEFPRRAFNLHVLSFSLAFILSQDQTHTCFSFILFLARSFFFTCSLSISKKHLVQFQKNILVQFQKNILVQFQKNILFLNQDVFLKLKLNMDVFFELITVFWKRVFQKDTGFPKGVGERAYLFRERAGVGFEPTYFRL